MLFQEFWKNWGKVINSDGSRNIETEGTMSVESFLQNESLRRYEDETGCYLRISAEKTWKVFRLDKQTKEIGVIFQITK